MKNLSHLKGLLLRNLQSITPLLARPTWHRARPLSHFSERRGRHERGSDGLKKRRANRFKDPEFAWQEDSFEDNEG